VTRSATTEPAGADPLRKALTHSLAFWAIAAPVWVLVGASLRGSFARDFRYAFLPAAHAIVHGDSPYTAAGPHALAEGTAFLYPPLSAYLTAPFTLLPPTAASVLATVLVVLALPATLLLLRVSDWRCHAVAFLWWPTIIAIQTANVTLPMLLGLALAWRYRSKPVVVALALGCVVALKPFMWPVLLWPPATGRFRTAALGLATSAVLVFLPWASVGFAGLRAYPHLLARVSRLEGAHSYSVAALVHAALPSWTAATAVALAAGAVVLLLVFRSGRQGRDRDAFALSVAATLLLTPLVEMHYFALLLVVVSLYRPRLSAAWVVPILFWGVSAANVATPAQLVHVLLVAIATVVFAMTEWRPRSLRRMLRPATA
jgi:hypothetical protein